MANGSQQRGDEEEPRVFVLSFWKWSGGEDEGLGISQAHATSATP